MRVLHRLAHGKNWRDRNAMAPQCLYRSIVTGHGRQPMFDRTDNFIAALDAITGPCESGISAEFRSADSVAQADPLFVGHCEDDDPAPLTLEDTGGAGEGVMKSGGFHLASTLAGAVKLHADSLTMKIGIK